MSRFSLAYRLLFLVLLCIVPLAAVLFYNLYTLSRSQEAQMHASAYRLGEVASLEMARIIGGAEDTLLAVAETGDVRSFDIEKCNAYVARLIKSLPQFSGIALVDDKGTIRCLQNPAGIGVSIGDKDYFKQTFATGKTILGKFTRGRVSGQFVLPISVPVYDDTRRIVGVIAGSLNLKWLETRLTERQFARESSLTVADADGVIVARHPYPEKFVGTRIPDEFQSLVHAESPGTIELTSQDGTRRVLGYFPPADPASDLYISVGLSVSQEYASIVHALLRGAAVTLLAIAVAGSLAWYTARNSIRRPVQRLVSTVNAWRNERTDMRTGLGERDGEFGIVGRAIDAYMDELLKARAQGEILMRELDHRVKNLLATVQVVARQSLRQAGVDPAVSSALTARLAAMASAHAVLMTNDQQSADIGKVVQSAIAPFLSETGSNFSTGGPAVQLGSSAALAFTMALHELCTNAAKYGSLSTDGRVVVEWKTETRQGESKLVFDWREEGGPAATTPGEEGFGSLMIRRMLPQQLGGELEINYGEEGMRLRYTLPLEKLNSAVKA